MLDATIVVIVSDSVASGIDARDHSIISSGDVDRRNCAALINEVMLTCIIGIIPEGITGTRASKEGACDIPAVIEVMAPPWSMKPCVPVLS